ncbi:MAG: hypothetical protein LBM77_12350 [Spirochaetaceae bacterium]|jgi:hypothetical protein|nr:hypothetical protein [Spirochaetaceae bacterium]
MTEKHTLIKATIIPEVIKLIGDECRISEEDAMKKFYESPISDALDDDETGLWGMSPLYIFSLFKQEAIDLDGE